MQFIMPTVLFIGLSNLMGIQILVPTNREKLVVYSTIIGALVDIVLNAFMIPSLGASGAAISGTVAEFAVALVQFIFIKEFMLPIIKQVQFNKLVISLVLATVLTIFLKNIVSVAVFFQLVMTAMVFFGTYGVMLLLLKETFVIEISQSFIHKIKK